MGGRERRLDIQGLRALAVLLVVAYHAGVGLHGGFIGVDVFFVVSGFVITSLLVRELHEHGRISFVAFYRRRALRLFPALGLMVLTVGLVGVLAAPIDALHVGGLTGVAASLFVANAYLYLRGTGYFVTTIANDPLLHLWTLAVEEQFYLAFPAVLLLGWRVWRARGAALALAAVLAVSFALSLLLSYGRLLPASHRPQEFAFYSSPTRAWEFGVGALLALAGAVRLPAVVTDLVAGAGLVAIVGGAIAISSTSDFPGVAALAPVLGTAAVILARGGARLRPLLTAAPANWVGDRSYSWYLWHWPLIVYARALWPNVGWVPPLAAAASLVPAALAYCLVEDPLRRRRRLSHVPVVRIAVASAAFVLVGSGALLIADRIVSTTNEGQAWSAARAPHIDVQRGCEGPQPLDRAKLSQCTWTVPGARGRVVLVGDSTASSLSEAVAAAGATLGLDVTVSTYYGCPFIQLLVYGSSSGAAACRRVDRAELSAIEQLRPALVVIVNRVDDYVESTDELAPLGGTATHTSSKLRALWASGLHATVAALTSRPIHVLLVGPVPRIAGQPAECAVIRILTRTCSGTAPRSQVDAHLAPLRQIEAAAVAGLPNVSTLDLENAFCSLSECSSIAGRNVLYTDSDHLSPLGSRRVAARVATAIRRAIS